MHDPGKIVVDLALCAALGGDHLSDLALLRSQGELFGPVASDPTVCRLMKTLAGDADAVEAAVEAARGEVRRRVWSLAGEHAPTAGISAASPLVIDVDATLVEVHSAKEGAAPTFKGGFGYHPLTAWFDHGPHGAGECAAIMLRPGNAGANTAADHIEVISRALDQAGLGSRPGRKVLVRIDGAGGTRQTVGFLARRRVSYSVGFKLPDRTPQIYAKIPAEAWAPAYNADGDPREGADVAEITGMLDLSGWPEACGSSCAANDPTPAPGCASTTWADTGSPPWPPTRAPGSSPTWKSATGCGPGARTASAAPRTPAWDPPPAGPGRQPHLVPDRGPGPRPARLDPDARPDRPPRPQVGAQDDPRPAHAHPRHHRPPRPPRRPALQGRPPLDPSPPPGHRPPPDPARTLTSGPAPEDAP